MDSFNDQKDELESSLDEIKSSYGDQIKNIAASVEAQAKGTYQEKTNTLLFWEFRNRRNAFGTFFKNEPAGSWVSYRDWENKKPWKRNTIKNWSYDQDFSVG